MERNVRDDLTGPSTTATMTDDPDSDSLSVAAARAMLSQRSSIQADEAPDVDLHFPDWAVPVVAVQYDPISAQSDFITWLASHALSGRAHGGGRMMPLGGCAEVAMTARTLVRGVGNAPRNGTSHWPPMADLPAPSTFHRRATQLGAARLRYAQPTLRWLPEWLASVGLVEAGQPVTLPGAYSPVPPEWAAQYHRLAQELCAAAGTRKISVNALRHMIWGVHLWMEKSGEHDYVFYQYAGRVRSWPLPSLVDATLAVWGSKPADSSAIFCDRRGVALPADIIARITGIAFRSRTDASNG